MMRFVILCIGAVGAMFTWFAWAGYVPYTLPIGYAIGVGAAVCWVLYDAIEADRPVTHSNDQTRCGDAENPSHHSKKATATSKAFETAAVIAFVVVAMPLIVTMWRAKR